MPQYMNKEENISAVCNTTPFHSILHQVAMKLSYHTNVITFPPYLIGPAYLSYLILCLYTQRSFRVFFVSVAHQRLYPSDQVRRCGPGGEIMSMQMGTRHCAHMYADPVIEMEVTDVSCSDSSFASRCCVWQCSWLGYK